MLNMKWWHRFSLSQNIYFVSQGGLGLNNKEMLRVYEELSKDWSIFASVMCHNDIIIKCIQLYGTEEQKQKYLPGLASGSLTGAFCLHEDESGQDIASIQTTGRYTHGQSDTIKLNGKKTWITNGADADILIVFAKLHVHGSSESVCFLNEVSANIC